jgi:hypothetical protein
VIPHGFHPEADVEFGDAAAFYESKLSGLGASFVSEVERSVALIRERPDLGTPVGLGRRRVPVDRFPYSVVYRRGPNSILVLAVADQRRRPGYWRHRK